MRQGPMKPAGASTDESISSSHHAERRITLSDLALHSQSRDTGGN